jgi:hypothetical protein
MLTHRQLSSCSYKGSCTAVLTGVAAQLHRYAHSGATAERLFLCRAAERLFSYRRSCSDVLTSRQLPICFRTRGSCTAVLAPKQLHRCSHTEAAAQIFSYRSNCCTILLTMGKLLSCSQVVTAGVALRQLPSCSPAGEAVQLFLNLASCYLQLLLLLRWGRCPAFLTMEQLRL